MVRPPSRAITAGSTPGNSSVGCLARGPWRSKPTCTVSGIFIVDGRRPEPIVLRHRIALAAGEHAERYAAESELRAVLELGDGIVEVGPRDDAEPDRADRARPRSTPRRASRCRRGPPRGRRRRRPWCARGAGPSACWGRAPRLRGRPGPARAMRCSGGPTPAVSATVTPKGCHVSLVRPALRSRNGTGRGSWPSTSSASPPSGSLIVRGAFSRSRAGIRPVHRSGSTSRCPSLEIKGGNAV